MSRRSAPSALSWDDVPRLSARVAVEPRRGTEGMRIVTVEGVPSSRVSDPVARLLVAMDGRTTVRGLKEGFAPDEADDDFLALLRRVQRSGLLAGAERRPSGRAVFRPPLTIQVATLRAPGLFAVVDRVVGRIPMRWSAATAVLLAVAGGAAAVLQHGALGRALVSPVPLGVLLVVALSMMLATLVHEAAHGAVLTRFGEAPRRAGIMLLYLAPAFFVDVTNGWRLPDRRARVAVALAGPGVHAALGGICFLAAGVTGDGAARTALLLLGAASTGVVLVNLIPFVRFDGYLALMSWLDEPGLRARTIADAGDAVRRLLFGGPPAPLRLDRWWGVPFGLLSATAPVALVLYAVGRVLHALSGGGVLAAGAALLIVLVLVVSGAALLVRALIRIARSGVRPIRLIAVAALLGATVGVTGAAIRIPETVVAGYVVAEGRIDLVAPPGAVPGPFPDGATVELLARGLLAEVPVADGIVSEAAGRGGSGAVRTVPTGALLPVEVAGAGIPAASIGSVHLDLRGRSIPETGAARIHIGTADLWRTAWRDLVAAPVAALLGGAR